MLNRYGMNRFKKAESAEPFSVKPGSVKQQVPPPQEPPPPQQGFQQNSRSFEAPPAPLPSSSTATGSGGSNWQPPDWAVEFKPGVYVLEVLKEGGVVDKVCLEKKRALFGRQALMCDYVLDHPSVSRQHAAVVQHKNGSVYVIDLGSVHGTFVSNERLSKDNPVELEVGQSLRFAASTRSYVLRKNILVPSSAASSQSPANFVYPPAPDPADQEAVVAYNTSLNRLGVPSPTSLATNLQSKPRDGLTEVTRKPEQQSEKRAKRARISRVSFRDEHGGVLVDVVGISDGADVSTEPGPIGVREGSLVGKYESLVQVTVIPKGQDDTKAKVQAKNLPGVTQRLKQYLDKVKSPGKGGLYEDLYGDSLAGFVGGSWAGPARKLGEAQNPGLEDTAPGLKEGKGNDTLGTGLKLEAPQERKTTLEKSRAGLEAGEDNDLFSDSVDERPVPTRS
ncbi:unnamed protein product [Sphagnum balticum]